MIQSTKLCSSGEFQKGINASNTKKMQPKNDESTKISSSTGVSCLVFCEILKCSQRSMKHLQKPGQIGILKDSIP